MCTAHPSRRMCTKSGVWPTSLGTKAMHVESLPPAQAHSIAINSYQMLQAYFEEDLVEHL